MSAGASGALRECTLCNQFRWCDLLTGSGREMPFGSRILGSLASSGGRFAPLACGSLEVAPVPSRVTQIQPSSPKNLSPVLCLSETFTTTFFGYCSVTSYAPCTFQILSSGGNSPLPSTRLGPVCSNSSAQCIVS